MNHTHYLTVVIPNDNLKSTCLLPSKDIEEKLSDAMSGTENIQATFMVKDLVVIVRTANGSLIILKQK